MPPKKTKRDEIRTVISSMQSHQGLVIVVSGPSGAGKTSVCEKLVAKSPDLSISVSFTTRRPRKGEKNGRHYYFVSKQEFLEECGAGRFLEWAEVHGHCYGTPRDYIEQQIQAGKHTVLDIDVQGARAMKEAYRDAVLIFLVPPSLAELERRLKGRKSDSPDDISIRLKVWAREFSCYPMYDYLVINGDIGETVETIHAIIKAEKYRTSRLNA